MLSRVRIPEPLPVLVVEWELLLVRTAVDRYPNKFIVPDFVSYLGGKRGAVCGKRLTFLYTSRYEHVQYNVWDP